MRKQFYFFAVFFFVSISQLFSQGEKLKKINFLPMWVPQSQFAGYYMAKEKGIYEKYGLDVNIINGGYNKDVTTMLKNSEVDFGILYLSEGIEERANGIELVNIAQVFQSSEIMFVSKKGSGINSLKDFNGKRIALWRTILKELTTGFLKKHNIEAEIFQINEGVNLFLKGAVDICAVMNFNEYNTLINYGINPDELNVFPFKNYGMDFPEDGIYCMEKTYNNDPELCRKFVDASLEGWKYALEHNEETLTVIRKIQKLENIQISKSHSQWMLKCMGPAIHPSYKQLTVGELLESDFNNTLEFLIENKIITERLEFRSFYKGAR